MTSFILFPSAKEDSIAVVATKVGSQFICEGGHASGTPELKLLVGTNVPQTANADARTQLEMLATENVVSILVEHSRYNTHLDIHDVRRLQLRVAGNAQGLALMSLLKAAVAELESQYGESVSATLVADASRQGFEG